MKNFEVEVVQEKNGRARVIHHYFDDLESARVWADHMAMNVANVTHVSLYKRGFLLMDVL